MLFCYFKNNFFILLHLTIFIKIGFWPFYEWMVSICQKIGWSCIFLIITFQKLNPLWVLSFYSHNFITDICILINGIVVFFLCLNQSRIRLLFCYLSMLHISWIVSCVSFDWIFSFIYIINYILISLYFILFINEYQNDNIYTLGIQHIDFFIFIFSILCIAGIPPLGGFLAKFFLFFKLINYNFIYIGIYLIFLSCCVFFIYCNIIVKFCVLSFVKRNELFLNSSNFIMSFFRIFSQLLSIFFLFFYFLCI